MSNFDEEIKRINDEMMADGTVDQIIRDNLKKAYETAIGNAFRWGDLNNAIEKRIKEIMVPAIERSDLSEYVTKLDDVLTQIIHETALPDHKTLIENFKTLTCDKMPKIITLEEILEKYGEFVAEDLDCCGREVLTDDSPTYVDFEAMVCVEESDTPRYTKSEYAVLSCTIGDEEDEDNRDTFERKINLVHYSWDKEEGYRIEYSCASDITNLRNLPAFDAWLIALSQSGTHLVAELGDHEEDDFEPKAEPECEWS